MQTPESVRFKLTIHYDGTRFRGWQVQPDERTVQGVIEAAVHRLTGEDVTVLGSGRTDTGVHATGQVAGLLLPARWTAGELRRAMNAVLPDDVWLSKVVEVPDSFHPRYDATARTYVYRVGLTGEADSPFVRRWCWPLAAAVDRALLDRAAEALVGRHSFRAFAKSGQPHRGDRCHVRVARWDDWPPWGVRFTITADRYLHRMVRYLVGTMVDIGRDRRALGDLERLLAVPDGDLTTSPPAPPEGLFLAYVEYPSDADGSEADPPPAEARLERGSPHSDIVHSEPL